MTVDVDDEEPILIFFKNGMLSCYYAYALSYVDGWPWMFKKKYAGATIICKNGNAFKISELKIVKPYGKSFLSQLLSVLTLNWEITLTLDSFELSLDQTKKMIVKGILLDIDNISGLNKTDSDSTLIFNIENSYSCEEIFDLFSLNSEDDLDHICAYSL